jgi:hypothetical protein
MPECTAPLKKTKNTQALNSRVGAHPQPSGKAAQRPNYAKSQPPNRSPEFDETNTLFAMPREGGTTLLFEPTVAHWLLSFPSPCFGFGVGLFLFGLIGFLRFHRWAILGIFFGCMIAVFLSMIHTQLVYDAFLPTGKAASIASCDIGRSVSLFLASCVSLLRHRGSSYFKGILVQVITPPLKTLNPKP